MGFFDFWRKKPAAHARRFDAAQINRLVAGWQGAANRIDDDLRTDLDRLRARSRDLANNNDYVRKFLRIVSRNVVGPAGFILQARASDNGRPDALANAAIEAAWARWCRRGSAEISGRLSFSDLCRQTISGVARDGEALIRILRGNHNAANLALQPLDINRLETNRNRASVNGENAIVMGVEIDVYQRPVAYWMRLAGQAERIDARDILHIYLPERAEQTRGVPWTHSAMLRLHNLKGYEEAAIVNARVGAAKMGFFVTPDGTGRELANDTEAGEFISEVSAGEFGVLPAGYDFKSFDPDYPHQQFGEFVKSHLRGIAAGLDVAYNGLANDLEGVNYSSIRAGLIEERDQWTTLQAWFIEAMLEPIYAEWLPLALLNGAITLPNGSVLPITKADKFAAHEWQGRRWSWVDPKKDIEAARLAVKSGIASPQQIAAQNGQDIEDVLDAIAAFEAMAKAKGVSLIDYDTQQDLASTDKP
jgi:lambda family phage portal protein